MKRAVALGALFLLSVIGCTRDGSGPSGSGGPTKGTVGISVLTMTNPFFKEIADTFSAEMGKAGYRTIVLSGDEDAAKQRAQVKDLLAQKVSAILLCPCDSRAVGAAIREANEAGVPVFTADIASLDEGAKVVTHVATDNYEGGKQAAQAMIEALGEAGGKIIILDYPEVESCIQRVKGFKEVIAAHNQSDKGGKITIAAELPGKGNKEQAHKTTADALQQHPDLAGIFAINDPSALGAHVALARAGKADRVKLIGFDGQPEGKQAILEGKIYADPIQHPDQIGRKSAEAILQYLRGEQPPEEILIPTRLYRKADAEKDPSLKKG